MLKCLICRRNSTDNLCKKHNKEYVFDKDIAGYKRRKKRKIALFHKTEAKLVKILDRFYGSKNVVVGYHPLWAVSSKNALLEFDAYIKNLDVLIEYNSIIHYKFTKFFHRTRANFQQQQERDAKKAELAGQNLKCLVIITENDPLFNDYIVNKIKIEKEKFNGTSI